MASVIMANVIMASVNKYNAFKLAEEALTQNLKDQLEVNIMADLIEEFKRKARPVIKEEVEKLMSQKGTKEQELDQILSKTIQQMWMTDLHELQLAYTSYKESRERAMINTTVKNKSKTKSKSKPKSKPKPKGKGKGKPKGKPTLKIKV